MGCSTKIGFSWTVFAVLAMFMLAGLRAAHAGACILSGPRYQLRSDTVDWSMRIDRGQNCSSDFQRNTILSSSPGSVALESVKLILPPQSGHITIMDTGFLYVAGADLHRPDNFTLAVSGAMNGIHGNSNIHIFVTPAIRGAPSSGNTEACCSRNA